ncbi:MAG: DUF3775 domain-containing protein [Alphaproteobacteria bacterium]|nr:DUF3775 domain-containing protein [Alphaproteobacteria bacterium]
MLTIPIERITLILDRASEVEPADLIESEVQAETETGEAGDESVEEAFVTPAQRLLIAALETLNNDDLYELLALAEMAGFEGSPGSWDSAVRRARLTAAEDAVDHLVRILVLSDAVEVGLDRLGYDLADETDEADEGEDVEANSVTEAGAKA